jgi:hypothetical protein
MEPSHFSELNDTTVISYTDLSTLLIKVTDSLKPIKIADLYVYWHAQQVLLFGSALE